MRGLGDTNKRLIRELTALTTEATQLRGRCAYAEAALCAEVERDMRFRGAVLPLPRPVMTLPISPSRPTLSPGGHSILRVGPPTSMYEDARQALAFRAPLSPLGMRF